ncbi:hypothetical protein PS662_04344 [Pseudomonas fluorescens]|uniref:DUF2256 domain-containing protein n=1 Tax=Pseudomonas fluorescens TaxID=294 RepID=A0A5E6VRC8_PSEFL|nr:hypothetical protein [Pseudomonas fluorescens]VVN20555.1 hypothetical protein PS662_04344 [Pseudomonas fluorescens]
MAATVEVSCAWCKGTFSARIADRKRGWARFCSKACKASKQQFGGDKSFWETANPNNKRSNIGKYADRLIGRADSYDGVPASRRSDKDWDDRNPLDDISDWEYGASDGGLNC